MRRRGFTLIELLVVVAIIGVLIALLLPAVQQVRAAARKADCNNRLKQLALAMHNYHDGHHTLPWGHGPFGWNDWSSLTLMLPYFEQSRLYDSINFAGNISGAAPGNVQNSTAQRTKLRHAICPADDDRLTNAEGHVNYAGCTGASPDMFPTVPDGLFAAVPDGPIVTFNDIGDGLSQTAAFSEKVKGIGPINNTVRDLRHPSASITQIGRPGVWKTPKATHDRCEANGPYGNAKLANMGPEGKMWHSGHPWCARYNHVMTPNTWSCVFPHPSNGTNLDNGGGAFTASSYHPGGVNVAFADGSVRFVEDSIDMNVWWAMGTRTGGETIPTQ
jgi:prepilin-type N-terminal cleavage/methylation domain-containing protein/prepilin-type processing-associated H-X9-DG protein